VSNHARPGGQSRHNLTYWRGGVYAGIGPGAHGRHVDADGRRIATVAHRAPGDWLRAVSAGNGEAERVVLDPVAARDERLVMGLRLAEGLPLCAIGLPADAPVILDGMAEGWLWRRDGRIGATASGMLLLNRVIAEISQALDQRESSAVRA
jgi:oxygen-independent coproporphyrinogen-3 oxidase